MSDGGISASYDEYIHVDTRCPRSHIIRPIHPVIYRGLPIHLTIMSRTKPTESLFMSICITDFLQYIYIMRPIGPSLPGDN